MSNRPPLHDAMILRMAQAMKRSYWCHDLRASEKRLITMAGKAFDALRRTPEGVAIIDDFNQLELFKDVN